MKKFFLLFTFLAAAVAVAQAQEMATDTAAADFQERRKIQYGFKVGANLSNLNGDVENNNSRTGYHGGIFADLQLTGRLSLRPEALYSSQGYDRENSDTTKLILNYVNVPVLVSYKLWQGLHVEAGPYVGFRLESRIRVYDSGFNIHNTHKPMDFGAAAGLRYDLGRRYFFGARYQYGFADISRADTDLRNQVLQVSAGIVIP